ncbi:hypothetical protein EI94DRAFT_1802972 [Lactarius quietus]|nr:hypothetical protein EI94DRAFT_1802972 [Lactarius quietus]
MNCLTYELHPAAAWCVIPRKGFLLSSPLQNSISSTLAPPKYLSLLLAMLPAITLPLTILVITNFDQPGHQPSRQALPPHVGAIYVVNWQLDRNSYILFFSSYLSRSDIVSPSDNVKTRRCMHEHWKDCQDYPEAHKWVGKDPEYDEEEQVRALVWSQETDEEDYIGEGEALKIAQLVSGMLVHAKPSSAGTSTAGHMKVT